MNGEPDGGMHSIRLQAEALIAVDRERRRLAPSTIGSTPGFRRARPMVPLARCAVR
jgi:hypothetical protein